MAPAAMGSRTVVLLALAVAAANSLTMDPDATFEVIEAATAARHVSGGVVAIVVRGGASGGKRESLLHAEGPGDSSFSLYYNKKIDKVSLESTHDGQLKSVTWGVSRSHSSTLVLVISERRVRLHSGCKPLHSHAAPRHHDLLALLAHHKLKLYHEENAPIEVYSSEKAALDALSCDLPSYEQTKDIQDEKSTDDVESDMVEVRDIIDKDVKEMQDGRNKREDVDDKDEMMQSDDYTNNYIAQHEQNSQRGDQPSRGFESCDDALIRELIRLRQVVEALRGDIGAQKEQMNALRQQMEQCCRAPQPPPPPRCSAGSCYPGY